MQTGTCISCSAPSLQTVYVSAASFHLSNLYLNCGRGSRMLFYGLLSHLRVILQLTHDLAVYRAYNNIRDVVQLYLSLWCSFHSVQEPATGEVSDFALEPPKSGLTLSAGVLSVQLTPHKFSEAILPKAPQRTVE